MQTSRLSTKLGQTLFALAGLAAGCSVFEPPGATSDGGSTSDAALGGAAGVGGSLGGGGGQSGSGGTAGTPDAGPTGPWWNTKSKDGCDSVGVPTNADRPSVTDPGAPLAPIYLATTRLRFGSASDDAALTANDKAWLDIGLDIDLSCTNSSTCTVNGTNVEEHACKNDLLVPFDGTQCRDNQIGKLYPVAALSPFVGPLFGITEPNWNCALHRGEFGLIFKLSEYNGEPNDASVRVDLYTSMGLQTLQNWTCTSGSGGGVPDNWFKQAPWLHTAHWKIADSSLDPTGTPTGNEVPPSKYADPAAFVRDGYLFASLPPATEFWLDGERAHVPGFRLLLHRSVLIGKIEKAQDGTWKLLEGTMAGVVLPNEILGAFRELGFCQNMCVAYDNVVAYLNTNQDTLSNTSAKLPDTACNALSIGIGLEARQATATAKDVDKAKKPVDCPAPQHPLAPQHGCVCPDPKVGGPCVVLDGGAD